MVSDLDHLNGKLRGYAQNKCNLQAKNNFVPIYAFILLIMITTYV